MLLAEESHVIDIDDLCIDTPTRGSKTLAPCRNSPIILSDDEDDTVTTVARSHSTTATLVKAQQAVNARGKGPSLSALFGKKTS